MYYAPSFSFVVCCRAMADQDATTALEAVPQVSSGELLQDSPVRRPLATEFQQVDDPPSSGDKLQANSPGPREAGVPVHGQCPSQSGPPLSGGCYPLTGGSCPLVPGGHSPRRHPLRSGGQRVCVVVGPAGLTMPQLALLRQKGFRLCGGWRLRALAARAAQSHVAVGGS